MESVAYSRDGMSPPSPSSPISIPILPMMDLRAAFDDIAQCDADAPHSPRPAARPLAAPLASSSSAHHAAAGDSRVFPIVLSESNEVSASPAVTVADVDASSAPGVAATAPPAPSAAAPSPLPPPSSAALTSPKAVAPRIPRASPSSASSRPAAAHPLLRSLSVPSAPASSYSPQQVPGLLARLLPAFDAAVTTSVDPRRSEQAAVAAAVAAMAAAAASKPVARALSTPNKVPRDPKRKALSAVAVNVNTSIAALYDFVQVSAAQPRKAAPRGVVPTIAEPLSGAAAASPPASSRSGIPPVIDLTELPEAPATSQGSFIAASLFSPIRAKPPVAKQLRFASPSPPPPAGPQQDAPPSAAKRPVHLTSPAAVRAASVASSLRHPVLERMRLFHSRSEWLSALVSLPLFDAEFSSWRSLFTLAIEWLTLQQEARRKEREAGLSSGAAASSSIRDDGEDGWEEQPGQCPSAASASANAGSQAARPSWTARTKNTGRGLEEYTALLLQLRGYTRTTIKGGPRDGGIDLLAARPLAEAQSDAAVPVASPPPAVPSSASAALVDMAAVQCKEYYGNNDSNSYYSGTVTTEEVRAFHSCIVGLEFFNLQRMDQQRMHPVAMGAAATQATTAASSSSGAAAASVSPLIADVRCLSVAYLVSTGCFAQQARDFISAFNRAQQRKWPQGCHASVPPRPFDEADPYSSPDDEPPFRGPIELVDSSELLRWVQQAERQDACAIERVELQRATTLLWHLRTPLWQHGQLNYAPLMPSGDIDTAAWPWQLKQQ